MKVKQILIGRVTLLILKIIHFVRLQWHPEKRRKKRKIRMKYAYPRHMKMHMQKQKESQKKMEKDEYDIYGALVATKLRKMDEITRQYDIVMDEIDNLKFRAIIQSTSHKNIQPHPSQNTASSNYVQQAYSLPTHLQTFNYTQQPFLSPSQYSTFSHTSQPSPSNSSTPSRSSQVSPPHNNSSEASNKVVTTINYVQPYSLSSQNTATLNYVHQPSFSSPSQCSTFSHTSQPSPSNYSTTTSCLSQVSPSLNNSKEAPTKVVEGTVDYDWLNQNLK